MKTPVLSFASDYIEPGTYPAVFMGRVKGADMKHGGTIFWNFLVGTEDEPLTIAGISSTSFCHDERCKAMKWAMVIDPKLTVEDESWDDENAVGNMVQIVVEDRRTGEDVISRIAEVLPCQAELQEPASEKS